MSLHKKKRKRNVSTDMMTEEEFEDDSFIQHRTGYILD